MNSQAYDRITERIIALLEQGTVPWHKPWKVRAEWPRNLVTKKPYRGINVFLLATMNYESPWWLTFRQACQLGAWVRKGEKACMVVFWKPMKMEDKESGEERKISLLRLYYVFNVSQCEWGEKSSFPELPEAPPPALSKPEEIVAGMPLKPSIKHGKSRAYYSPREDYVGMPSRKKFDREAEYYSTLYHELIHATGSEKRLNRPTLTANAGFGSDPYCREELIAEMGAAFLCGQAGIVDQIVDNSAAYLDAWLERLSNDRTLIVHAAAQAQKAADYILGIQPGEIEEESTRAETSPEPVEVGS